MMRFDSSRRGLCAGALVAAVLSLGAAAVRADDARLPDPRKMVPPTLNPIQAPKPERFELANGMVVFLLEDHDFPLVDARATVRVGSIYEPGDKAGLADITGEVIRTGGSIRMSGDALDQQLESMGASVETSIGETKGDATVSTLAENFGEGLEILGDLLQRPAFPQEKIELAEKQLRTSIASRNDDPETVLFRETKKLLYGPEHPYARVPEYSTVDAITRDDLVAFHRRFFHPDRVIMTVYGDFQTAAVKQKLTEVFGAWARSTEPMPPDPAVEAQKLSGNYLIEKKDMTNSGVIIAQLGMRMDDPDYAPMSVWGEILGGGFSSRLFNEIRTRRGLAYATGAGIGAGYHHPGALVLFAMTRADSTVKTLGYVGDELTRIMGQPIGDDEVRRAKDAILNTLVFDFSSKGAVLNRMADYSYYGYPMDFLQKYQAAVEKLTPADLQAAAARKVRPQSMSTLVMGNPSSFAADLPELGDFHTVDIAIPEPAGELIPPATEGDLARGQDLLAQAATASGGAALGKIRDLTLEEKGGISVQGQELAVTSKTVQRLPNCVRADQTLPFGTMTLAVCGQSGWRQTPRGIEDLPADFIADAQAERARDLLVVLTQYSGLKAQALASAADVDGRPADVVYVQHDLVKGWKIYLDRASHLIVRMEYRDKSPITGATVTVQEQFADYRKAGAVSWPYARKVLHDGELFGDFKVSSFTTNTGAADALFAKPTP